MRKEAEIFRQGIKQYFADLAQANANLAAEHAEQNAKDSPLINFTSPKFYTASLQDMAYWANRVEHYEFLAAPKESV